MAEWELRPLSLGEILDRTFSLYRKHFLLFLGISAIPHLLTLAIGLLELLVFPRELAAGKITPMQVRDILHILLVYGLPAFLVAGTAALFSYLFSQGGTIYAVSELYLGRQTTISASLGKMWGHLWHLFLVILLNGIAVIVGFLFLVIPGIYVACRLLTCIPAALLENKGAVEALGRSWELTEGSAGRAFAIYGLFVAMTWGITSIFGIPAAVLQVLAAKSATVTWLPAILNQIGSFVAQVLVGPFFLIGCSVFYYDLRVRKEAFDLQLMMHPDGAVPTGTGTAVVPTVLS